MPLPPKEKQEPGDVEGGLLLTHSVKMVPQTAAKGGPVRPALPCHPSPCFALRAQQSTCPNQEACELVAARFLLLPHSAMSCPPQWHRQAFIRQNKSQRGPNETQVPCLPLFHSWGTVHIPLGISTTLSKHIRVCSCCPTVPSRYLLLD